MAWHRNATSASSVRRPRQGSAKHNFLSTDTTPQTAFHSHKAPESSQKKRSVFVPTLVFLLGLAILVYPYIAQYVNNLSASRLVASYESAIVKMGEGPSDSVPEAGLEGDIFSTLFIPSLSLELPIYVGSTNENLNRGVAHLEGTSLPIGGPNTHAVLAAHNGAISNEWFTNINKLVQGDLFYIRYEGQTLTYSVISSKVIEPTDTSDLLIREGEDLVTLLTCTDGGARRLIVTGERTE